MNAIRSVTESRRPGQAHPVVTPQAIAAVEAIVIENRLVTMNETAAHLDISRGSAHHIVHDKQKLNFHFIHVHIYIFSILSNRTLQHNSFLRVPLQNNLLNNIQYTNNCFSVWYLPLNSNHFSLSLTSYVCIQKQN